MKKSAFAAIAMSLLLAACEGHQYERKEPGVTVSGTAGVGVVYSGGEVSPHTKTTLTISMGGSI
ncbi:hypothetical protein [Aliiroseovarius sp. PrR006]|uniref:hypothetical protein n=1 Tax=Aliiroseovarius sp. PrR006 TaxID=2706883 RepID=UPI0013D24DF4|nr:hypothetical protein [Aliiroseovarius sp. PrR006]NDW52829.1 hypothetical protein [Aliiroseovarius sp. PrR006]